MILTGSELITLIVKGNNGEYRGDQGVISGDPDLGFGFKYLVSSDYLPGSSIK
ncbi:hypothetical protein [Methanofollis formosanus]|uniref:hypothetical protein n=1 Tax=Methanofollis formosanus TaxID=299308 RepID=UPI001C7DD7E9|nr:hypothetical protein [Methanofollis formosanus]